MPFVDKKTIVIQNIYYMLAYAYQALHRREYERLGAERFENALDLLAAIIALAVPELLKRGLYCDYVSCCEELGVLRGKLLFPETLRLRARNRREGLVCEHDEFSENNIYNQIVKSTLVYLVHCHAVRTETRQKLKKFLPGFNRVDTVPLGSLNWRRLQFGRNNRAYETIIGICRLVAEGMIMSGDTGLLYTQGFTDELMMRVYEKFILNYYARHYAGVPEFSARSAEVSWALNREQSRDTAMLPHMQSDVMLECGGRKLIIDAKYYSHAVSRNFNKATVVSGNLYQIFAYVMNEAALSPADVSGLLLYARTTEDVPPSLDFVACGHRLGATTLDLSVPFPLVEHQLQTLLREWLGI